MGIRNCYDSIMMWSYALAAYCSGTYYRGRIFGERCYWIHLGDKADIEIVDSPFSVIDKSRWDAGGQAEVNYDCLK